MTAVAICSADLKIRDRLERQLRGAPGITVAGMVDDLHGLAGVVEQAPVDAVLADTPSRAQLKDWQLRHPGLPVIVLVDAADVEDALDALYAGAAAILPRSAVRAQIAAAIEAAISGLVIVPHDLLATLLDPRSPDAGAPLPIEAGAKMRLTPRELDVLAAMADGASNKAIARRLGISFHTAKFHVGSILGKLGAASRAEAVAMGIRRGLVLL